MALTATLYDFQLALSNVDRGVEQQLSFKVARHPSETMERVWLRVLALCWLWEERLGFGKGLGEPDAPDLELHDYTGVLTRWVRVGKADAAKVQKVVDQNSQAGVAVLFESPARLEAFVSEAKSAALTRLGAVQLAAVDEELLTELAADESRRCKATVTLVGDHFYIDRDGASLDGALTLGSA